MASERVSNTQLKALLAQLETAAEADHPLSAMFRGFVRDALLDLRDARQRMARQAWFIDNMEQHLRVARKEVDAVQVNLARDKPRETEFAYNRVEYVRQLLHDADTQRPYESLEKDAIAPLTGKEK